MIDSDPIEINITRTPKVPDGAGGFVKGTPVTLSKQTVAIHPFKRRFSEMLVNTEMGDVVDYPYVVLGRPGLDIQRGDTFTWQGDQFVVHTVDIKVDVRVKAQVDYYGGTSNV
jgi:hypothetical protein